MRAKEDGMTELEAHVEKLAELLDDAHACNDDCDLAAILAWVDPRDRQRIREMRDKLKEENAALRRALASIGTNTCGREPLAAAYARGVLSELKSG